MLIVKIHIVPHVMRDVLTTHKKSALAERRSFIGLPCEAASEAWWSQGDYFISIISASYISILAWFWLISLFDLTIFSKADPSSRVRFGTNLLYFLSVISTEEWPSILLTQVIQDDFVCSFANPKSFIFQRNFDLIPFSQIKFKTSQAENFFSTCFLISQVLIPDLFNNTDVQRQPIQIKLLNNWSKGFFDGFQFANDDVFFGYFNQSFGSRIYQIMFLEGMILRIFIIFSYRIISTINFRGYDNIYNKISILSRF